MRDIEKMATAQEEEEDRNWQLKNPAFRKKCERLCEIISRLESERKKERINAIVRPFGADFEQ